MSEKEKWPFQADFETSTKGIRELLFSEYQDKSELFNSANTCLLELIAAVIEFVDKRVPGAALHLYSDIEAHARINKLEVIGDIQSGKKNSKLFNIPDVQENDVIEGVNYIEKELLKTLLQTIHKLPYAFHSQQICYYGVEALLLRLIKDDFENGHKEIDRFCSNAHESLDAFQKSKN